jgi:hypothetical protein
MNLREESPTGWSSTQDRPQIPIQFSLSILFDFHGENGSMIKSFHTVAPNSLKPSWCTPYSSGAFP